MQPFWALFQSVMYPALSLKFAVQHVIARIKSQRYRAHVAVRPEQVNRRRAVTLVQFPFLQLYLLILDAYLYHGIFVDLLQLVDLRSREDKIVIDISWRAAHTFMPSPVALRRSRKRLCLVDHCQASGIRLIVKATYQQEVSMPRPNFVQRMSRSRVHKSQRVTARPSVDTHHKRVSPHSLGCSSPNLIFLPTRNKQGKHHPRPVDLVIAKLKASVRNVRPEQIPPARKQVHLRLHGICRIQAELHGR